jgi:hypothetical protein
MNRKSLEKAIIVVVCSVGIILSLGKAAADLSSVHTPSALDVALDVWNAGQFCPPILSVKKKTPSVLSI